MRPLHACIGQQTYPGTTPARRHTRPIGVHHVWNKRSGWQRVICQHQKAPEALHRRMSELHALGGHVPGVGPVSTSPGTASGAAESRPRSPAWLLCNGKYLASNASQVRFVSQTDTLGLIGHEDS